MQRLLCLSNRCTIDTGVKVEDGITTDSDETVLSAPLGVFVAGTKIAQVESVSCFL